jgi:hypothetical protein
METKLKVIFPTAFKPRTCHVNASIPDKGKERNKWCPHVRRVTAGI